MHCIVNGHYGKNAKKKPLSLLKTVKKALVKQFLVNIIINLLYNKDDRSTPDA